MTGQNFSISLKNFEKFFFAGNVLKHKVIPKNSRKSTFFSKLNFPPKFEKHLENFQDQALVKACLVQRFLPQALNLYSHLLVSSLVE